MRARFALLGVIATASSAYATALDVVGVVSAYFRSYVDLLMCVVHFFFPSLFLKKKKSSFLSISTSVMERLYFELLI